MIDREPSTIPTLLRVAFDAGTVSSLTDAQLLARFAARRDEAGEIAFAAIVARHGPMVLRTCRGLLGRDSDAHDAFQAVFLVLARKAPTLPVRDTLAPWLQAVASRVSANARASIARRSRHERQKAEHTPPTTRDPAPDDLLPLILGEIGRLPAPQRSAVILCDLQDLTHEQAALHLQCPVGTIKSRLSRAHDRLRDRLTRRGVTPGVFVGVSALLSTTEAAPIPAALSRSTSQSAIRVATAGLSAGVAPIAVVALSREVLRMMLLVRTLKYAALALLLGATGIGLGRAVPPIGQDPPPTLRVEKKADGAEIPRRVLREAAKMAIASKGVDYLPFSLLTIAKAQHRVGDLEGSKSTAIAASEATASQAPGARANALSYVARARDLIGDREGGLADLETARKVAGAIKTVSGRCKAWDLIAITQDDLGDHAAASATIEQMSADIAATGRASDRFFPMVDLVGTYTYIGDYEASFRIVEQPHPGGDATRGSLLGKIAETASETIRYTDQPEKPLSPEELALRRQVVDRALQMSSAFHFADERPIYELTRALENLGEFDAAVRLARTFGKGPISDANRLDPTTPPFLLLSIAASEWKAGRRDDSRAVLQEARVLIESDPKFESRWSQFIWAQATAGDVPGALVTLEKVSPPSRPSVLREIADDQEKAGDHAGAQATLRRALLECELMLDRPHPPRTRQGPVEITTDSDGKSPTPPADPEAARKSRLRSDIASFQARLGDLDGASKSLAGITSESDRAGAAGSIAHARVKAGDIEGTLAWALSLDPPAVRVGALRGLATGIAKP